mmetsp:Transcript_22756/g.58025  ORF Transcript_22756/g.58025 Transcript_22756/m.58025 type:complete len:393 (-) Transcript_22756:16-1194(-)
MEEGKEHRRDRHEGGHDRVDQHHGQLVAGLEPEHHAQSPQDSGEHARQHEVHGYMALAAYHGEVHHERRCARDCTAAVQAEDVVHRVRAVLPRALDEVGRAVKHEPLQEAGEDGQAGANSLAEAPETASRLRSLRADLSPGRALQLRGAAARARALRYRRRVEESRGASGRGARVARAGGLLVLRRHRGLQVTLALKPGLWAHSLEVGDPFGLRGVILRLFCPPDERHDDDARNRQADAQVVEQRRAHGLRSNSEEAEPCRCPARKEVKGVPDGHAHADPEQGDDGGEQKGTQHPELAAQPGERLEGRRRVKPEIRAVLTGNGEVHKEANRECARGHAGAVEDAVAGLAALHHQVIDREAGAGDQCEAEPGDEVARHLYCNTRTRTQQLNRA